MPQIDIIILNYKGEKDTIECVDSLIHAGLLQYRIIIVDNNSGDNQANRLIEKYQEYSNVVVLKLFDNKGFSAGNNHGIKYSLEHGADYIVLLNNDTVIESDFVKELLKPFRINEKIVITTGKIMDYYQRDYFDCAGGKLIDWRGSAEKFGFHQKDIGQFQMPRYVTFAQGCLMMIDTGFLKQGNLLPEEYFMYYEDTAYCHAIRAKGLKIYYSPETVIFHKGSASSGKLSHIKQYYMMRNQMMYIKKNINGINKLLAYTHSLYVFFKCCIKKINEYSIVKKALKDFILGVSGKAEVK
jgi:GT2 family glycosyltransferase